MPVFVRVIVSHRSPFDSEDIRIKAFVKRSDFFGIYCILRGASRTGKSSYQGGFASGA